MRFVVIFCILSLLTITNSFGFEVESALDIILKIQQQKKIHLNQKYSIKMSIFNNGATKQVKYFDLKHYHKKDSENSLIEFSNPASIRGTKLLSLKTKQDSNLKQWIYTPLDDSIESVKPAKMTSPFMDSNFSYEDIVGRVIFKDNHHLLNQDKDFYYITSIPKKVAKNDYQKLHIIVDKKTFVPLKIEFFKDVKIKTLKNSNIVQIDKMYVATKSEMINHIDGSKTLIQIQSASIIEDFCDSQFSTNSLR